MKSTDKSIFGEDCSSYYPLVIHILLIWKSVSSWTQTHHHIPIFTDFLDFRPQNYICEIESSWPHDPRWWFYLINVRFMSLLFSSHYLPFQQEYFTWDIFFFFLIYQSFEINCVLLPLQIGLFHLSALSNIGEQTNVEQENTFIEDWFNIGEPFHEFFNVIHLKAEQADNWVGMRMKSYLFIRIEQRAYASYTTDSNTSLIDSSLIQWILFNDFSFGD